MTFADHGFVARRALPYAASLLALAVAAGCTSGSPPPAASTAVPTTTTSSTSSVAPTSATPAPSVDPVIAKIPAAARKETIEGASAYVNFYFDSLNRAFREADPESLKGLSRPSCSMCNSLSDGVAEVRAAGNHYGGNLSRVNFSTASEFTPSTRRVLVSLDQLPVPILNSSGKRVDTTRAAKLSFLATMEFDSRWIITRLQKVAS